MPPLLCAAAAKGDVDSLKKLQHEVCACTCDQLLLLVSVGSCCREVTSVYQTMLDSLHSILPVVVAILMQCSICSAMVRQYTSGTATVILHCLLQPSTSEGEHIFITILGLVINEWKNTKLGFHITHTLCTQNVLSEDCCTHSSMSYCMEANPTAYNACRRCGIP